MKKTKSSRKAQVKSSFYYLKSACIAFVETLWAVMTSFAAGFGTHSIYPKGAPPRVERLSFWLASPRLTLPFVSFPSEAPIFPIEVAELVDHIGRIP